MRNTVILLNDILKIPLYRNDDLLKKCYNAQKKLYRKSIKEAKIKFNGDLIKKSNNKCLASWRFIKSEAGNYFRWNNDPPPITVFTEDVICANSFIFLTAGSESASSTINFTLFELSRNPDIQQLLQQEIDTVLAKHGGWTYEAIKDMVYLDQVIQETQRLYPVLPFMMRECEEPYNIPDSDVTIEKGVLVIIPVCALHKDPQYYPDPEEFKPERFEGNNFKPSPTFLPFGDGPRICIAMRFAVMEVKTCLARIMSQYSVKLSSKTQLPLQFDKRSVFPLVKKGIWLSFEKRNMK